MKILRFLSDAFDSLLLRLHGWRRLENGMWEATRNEDGQSTTLRLFKANAMREVENLYSIHQ